MRRQWPLFVLLLLGITWGLQFSLLKLAVERGHVELNVVMMTLILVSIAYAIMVGLRRGAFRITRERLEFFVIIAIIGYILPMAATLYAAPHVPAGIISMLASLAPMVTFAVALLLRTEPVSRARIGAMLLGCGSVVLVLAPQAELPGYGAFGWMLLVLVVPLCYGVESIYVAARWPDGLNVMQVGLGEAVVAAILSAPLFLLFGEPASFTIEGSVADLAVGLYVLCEIAEVFMYFYLVRVTGGVLVSFGTFISLFAGIGWGIAIFSEAHAAAVWVAVLILVAALAMVCLDTVKSARPAG